MTAADSLRSQPSPLHQTIFFNRLSRILRTSWREATHRRPVGGGFLIESNHSQTQPGRQVRLAHANILPCGPALEKPPAAPSSHWPSLPTSPRRPDPSRGADSCDSVDRFLSVDVGYDCVRRPPRLCEKCKSRNATVAENDAGRTKQIRAQNTSSRREELAETRGCAAESQVDLTLPISR